MTIYEHLASIRLDRGLDYDDYAAEMMVEFDPADLLDTTTRLRVRTHWITNTKMHQVARRYGLGTPTSNRFVKKQTNREARRNGKAELSFNLANM